MQSPSSIQNYAALKKFTFLAIVSFLISLSFSLHAQKPTGVPSAAKNDGVASETFERCGTMEALENRLKNDPAYRAQYEKNLRDFEASVNNNTFRTSALTGPVIIPVVVHIVLPNPNIITDADVQYFIDRLNKDFSGFNADSLNGAPFFPVRGHSLMRFAIARRDPSGALTNGVERKVGPGIIGGGEPQAIKSTATGGLNPWPFQQYYNLWVGVGAGGLLGIAPEIGVGTAATDGVSVDYRVFSNNVCYTIPQFRLGRTAVHEIGHNFGLYHTFQGGCGNADFSQLTTPSQQLPPELLEPSDDTPGQSTSTSGCPTGTAPTGCADFPDPPGKMYQNYMDYTDDACYSMFSNGQVNRMHYVLENFRSGYLSTQGHLPPAGAITLDAMVLESVNPGGYELDSCNIINYSATQGCAGPINPKFRIRNNGVAVITSITVGYTLNGGVAVTQTYTGLNLPTGATLVVSLPTANLVDGPNQFQFFTAAPNGGTDQNPGNDTLTVNINVMAAPLPVFEGFEGAFPPPPWTVVSVNAIGTRNWVKRPPGRNSANALFIENFNNAAGAIDDFRSGTLAANPTDVITIEFDVAYRHFNAVTAQDTLVVLISKDCGVTFQEVYKKWGINLSTGAQMTTSFVSPTAADWRTENITVSAAFISSGKFQVVFRSKSRFGNNIFIDNISIEKKFDRDLRLLTVLSPGGNLCTNNIAPRVQIVNTGMETVNSFEVTYSIDGVAGPVTLVNTPLAPGDTATVSLPPSAALAFGNHSFVATVTNVVFASGGTEGNTNNNSITQPFTRVVLNNAITQGFETAPIGWTVFNPNANNTWVITTPGRNSERSAFINNYDNNVVGHIDDLRSPFLTTTGIDSLIITFDVAHRNYPNVNDQLSVLAITGCGTVFTPTGYAKAGAVLATAGSSTLPFLTPGDNDWRSERISVGASVLGGSGNAQIAFRNRNAFGNNIFIDNVDIFPLFKRDLQLLSVNQPASVICAPTFTPAVTIRNNGTDTITGYKVSYSIDNGPAQTTTVTGVLIPRNATVTVTLPAATVAVGAHTIRVFSWEPVSRSGVGDNNTLNDTLVKFFSFTGTVAAPLVEGFENAQFPPDRWAIVNVQPTSTAWQRAPVGKNSTGSAFLNNFEYNGTVGQTDDLVTPTVTFSGVDSVKLMFDLSAVTRQYPGSALLGLDTLEVLVTKDCGNSFTTVYKKWGAALQTIGDPNNPQNYLFVPNSPSQWRTESIDLTAFAGNPSVQVYFRNTTNRGNNIYLDNVALTTRTLPARLKEQGYLVMPSVFASQFSVMFFQTPTTLRFVTVHSSGGQMVYKKEYRRGADRLISVNLSGQPAGTYIVTLGYDDVSRNVSERVIKR